MTRVPVTPGRPTPPISPAASTTVVVKRLRAAAAISGPSISVMRGAGLATRRSTNPPSMSRARVIPALMPAKPAPMTVASGIVKAR